MSPRKRAQQAQAQQPQQSESPAKSPGSSGVRAGELTSTGITSTGFSGLSRTYFGQTSNKLAETAEAKVLENLRNEAKIKDAAIAALTAKIDRLEDEKRSAQYTSKVERRHHPISTMSNLINDKGRQKVKVGTRGSLLTQNILEALTEAKKSDAQNIADKFLKVFQNPVNYITYLQSDTFAAELIQVCNAVSELLDKEPRCLFMQSPVYVFGDIHGNLEDLHFFADNIWKLGMDLTAGQFLFLGDYVDRGMSCLECVAYLFGLKVLYPHKIKLLRGNHETRDVNGWEEHYADKSFLFQCKDRFGADRGEQVWEECNQTFDRLPLAAIIDHEIFCIHGGIPRPIREQSHQPTEVQAIMALPSVVSIMPPYEYESEWMKQVATDCIWSDPASEEMESRLDATGFGNSPRGGGAVCFGSTAIDNFLEANNLSYIIRAHEAHAHGVSISKGARVFTVFSTSKDHRQGERAMAGCILVDCDQIQVINRSHKYKNKYVHRRTSVAVENLTSDQLEERRRLGLVRFSLAMDEMDRRRGRDSDNDDNEDESNDSGEGDAAESSSSSNKNHKPKF
eukprot:CAMPEP_0170073404 /NCGR_PEP_ID=MMETSP0019_2-20121128/10839_1 /TAXON_ID=98059 /ORGANISM="Dinobryon sp., Strain UTEXLB2267" /LENGTH=565 /DNA_ID=CAMNT_0010282935 /DNA_START=107 /DNA_END=1804 /DNA_ORIENTATION=+